MRCLGSVTLGGSLTLRMGSGGRHPNTSADVSPRVAASCIAKFRRRLPFHSRCVHRRAIAINAHIRSSSNPTAGADSRDISPMIIISVVLLAGLLVVCRESAAQYSGSGDILDYIQHTITFIAMTSFGSLLLSSQLARVQRSRICD